MVAFCESYELDEFSGPEIPFYEVLEMLKENTVSVSARNCVVKIRNYFPNYSPYGEIPVALSASNTETGKSLLRVMFPSDVDSFRGCLTDLAMELD